MAGAVQAFAFQRGLHAGVTNILQRVRQHSRISFTSMTGIKGFQEKKLVARRKSNTEEIHGSRLCRPPAVTINSSILENETRHFWCCNITYFALFPAEIALRALRSK